jgi:hypothetical protein
MDGSACHHLYNRHLAQRLLRRDLCTVNASARCELTRLYASWKQKTFLECHGLLPSPLNVFLDENWQPNAKIVCKDNEMSREDVRVVSLVSMPKGSRLRHANLERAWSLRAFRGFSPPESPTPISAR